MEMQTKKSESLRSVIKERFYKCKTKANVKSESLLFTLKDYGKFADNKKKIQMFFVKYVFYIPREVDNNYISFVASPLMKYKYCLLHS